MANIRKKQMRNRTPNERVQETLDLKLDNSLKHEDDTLDDFNFSVGFQGEPGNDYINGEDDLNRYDLDVQMSRTLSRRLTSTSPCISKEALPEMGGGKDYPPLLPDREIYTVVFDGDDDPIKPLNWPLVKRCLATAAACASALSSTVSSSMFSEAQTQAEEVFHVGREVAALGTFFFILGYTVGPVVWGPFSELYGRKIVLVSANIGFICFGFGCATAKDIQTVMLTRFFGGCFGAGPVTVCPPLVADIFKPIPRGKVMALFAMVMFGGPMIGPIMAAFAVKNPSFGWRWTSYVPTFICCLGLILLVFLVPETSHAIVLARKAEELRRRTGNWGIHAAHEEASLSVKDIVEKNIARPIVMLFTEPILFLITLYNAFIYGLLYILLTAIPLIFQGKYKWKAGVDVLPYLGVFIGTSIGGISNVIIDTWIQARLRKTGKKFVAEYRLIPMMVGSIPFCLGLFLLCWSGNYGARVHWIVPTIGGTFVGIGLLLIFLPCLNYIIDCYLFFAASAIAANTIMRSIFGAVCPLFAYQMFTNMHINWAGTLLGCVAAVLIPVPFLFFQYGHIVRQKSSYAFA